MPRIPIRFAFLLILVPLAGCGLMPGNPATAVSISSLASDPAAHANENVTVIGVPTLQKVEENTHYNVVMHSIVSYAVYTFRVTALHNPHGLSIIARDEEGSGIVDIPRPSESQLTPGKPNSIAGTMDSKGNVLVVSTASLLR